MSRLWVLPVLALVGLGFWKLNTAWFPTVETASLTGYRLGYIRFIYNAGLAILMILGLAGLLLTPNGLLGLWNRSRPGKGD